MRESCLHKHFVNLNSAVSQCVTSLVKRVKRFGSLNFILVAPYDLCCYKNLECKWRKILKRT